MLQFLNKPNQRTRLEELLQEQEAYIPLFDEDDEIPNFVNCVVKNRNYHIHGGKTPKCEFTVWEETIAVEALKLANLFLLLKYLGIPSEDLRPTAIASYRTWQHFYRNALGKKTLIRKLSEEPGKKYDVETVAGKPCYFCANETKLIKQTVLRDGEHYISRRFCPNEHLHSQSRNHCLVCGVRFKFAGMVQYCQNNCSVV